MSDEDKWYDYYDKYTDVSIQDAIEEIDFTFNFKYFRVKYTATGVTTGQLSFFLTDNNG